MFRPLTLFLENSTDEPVRNVRTALLSRLLTVAYSLVSVCPLWDTRAGGKASFEFMNS